MTRPEEVPAIAARLAKEVEALETPAEELLRRYVQELREVYVYLPTTRRVRIPEQWELNVCVLDLDGCTDDQVYFSGYDRDGGSTSIAVPVAWVNDPEGFFAEARKEQVTLAAAARRRVREDARRALATARRQVEELTEQLERED